MFLTGYTLSLSTSKLTHMFLLLALLVSLGSCNIFFRRSSSDHKMKKGTCQVPPHIYDCISGLDSMVESDKDFQDIEYSPEESEAMAEHVKWSQYYARVYLTQKEGKCNLKDLLEFKKELIQTKGTNLCYRNLAALIFQIDQMEKNRLYKGVEIEDESKKTVLNIANKMDMGQLMVVETFYEHAQNSCAELRFKDKEEKKEKKNGRNKLSRSALYYY